MPLQNYHSCRLRDPSEFVRFVTNTDSDPITVIGYRKDGSSDVQSFRYPTDKWSEEDARKHCAEHDGEFHPAASDQKSQTEQGAGSREQGAGRQASGELELRMLPGRDVKVESREDGKPKIVGYAAVFYDGTPATEAEIWDFRERVMPSAFDRTLNSDADVLALWNHNLGKLLGRRANNTLHLSADDHGLRYEIDAPATTHARDLIEHIRRGDVRGSSFSFRVRAERWIEDDDGSLFRELLDVELYDVGPVTLPAYPATSTGLRCAEMARKRHQELRETLEPVLSRISDPARIEERAGLDRGWIERFLAGRLLVPSPAEVAAIANELGLDPAALIGCPSCRQQPRAGTPRRLLERWLELAKKAA